MTDASRMAVLEDHQNASTERFDFIEACLNSLAAGMSRMESLLQSVLTARTADAVTYANITALQSEVVDDKNELATLSSPALQSEVVDDKNELATLTSPSPTSLSRLRSSALCS
jgi:hypothetical protein